MNCDAIYVPSATSRHSVYRQWRNWRTGAIIETINKPDEKTEIWWDNEFEAVVLFHHEDQNIVFCDPLVECLPLQPRHNGCEVIRLDEFNRLKEEYGGENTHGKNFYRIKLDLTLEKLLAINTAIRRKWESVIKTVLCD